MKAVKGVKQDFTEGKVLKKLIFFALPMALATLMQMLFNSADVAIVGRFAGSNSQAAVGATSSAVHLIVNLFVGLSVGANVVMANAYGAKDEARQQRVVHTAFAMALISGFVVLGIGLFLSRYILQWINTPQNVLEKATVYMQIYFIGAPALMVYNFCASIMRAVGETKKPLLYLLVAGVLNVLINVVTVVFFKWHVIGVALGTAVSQYVSAIWITFDLTRAKDSSRLCLRKVRLHSKEFRKILHIGLPMGLNSCCFSLANLFVQSSINAFGEYAIAGNTISNNVDTICDSFTSAVMNAVVTITGQNMGARKPERIKRIIGAGSLVCCICHSVYILIMVFFGKYVFSIYSADAVVIEWAIKRMKVVTFSQLFMFPMQSFGGALRGMGYSVFPMFINLCCTCVFRIVYMLAVYPFLPVQTIFAVYVLYPITWFLSSLLQTVFCIVCLKKELIKKSAETPNVE